MSFPSYFDASSSSIGATALHGTHQSAQKSTSTGYEVEKTFSLKLVSSNTIVVPIFTPLNFSFYPDELYVSYMPAGKVFFF
jgi:3D (Asp-Asp-Asp) domain-containing protein